jgi:hypothetical protein
MMTNFPALEMNCSLADKMTATVVFVNLSPLMTNLTVLLKLMFLLLMTLFLSLLMNLTVLIPSLTAVSRRYLDCFALPDGYLLIVHFALFRLFVRFGSRYLLLNNRLCCM